MIMDTSALVVLAFSAAAMLSGWWIFQHVRLPKPDLGVFSLGDIGLMLVAIAAVPPLYLAIPAPVIAGILLMAVGNSLHTLFSAILRSHRAVWSITVMVLAADVASAWLGPHGPVFAVINDVLLVAFTGTVAALWVQSGLRARDAAILTAGVAAYDLITTGYLPLTDNLIARLADIPVAPVVRWGPVSIGLGDLLILTLVPVVYRKAFGDTAGLTALTTGILGIVAALALRANGPLIAGLGPALIAQYIGWRHWHGPEQTTWQFLRKFSSQHKGKICVDTARLASSLPAA
jgi:hypothetical protein